MGPDRRTALALLWLLAAVPEPAGLWTGPMGGDVPATLRGATVLANAAAARRWIGARDAVLIDLAPAPVRPPTMAPTMMWMPPEHQDIPGSVWLPGDGAAARGAALLAAVRKLAGPPPGRPVVTYCHPRCWASWNAAKQLVLAGYRTVAWFPGGIEGWEAAGFELQRTNAKGS